MARVLKGFDSFTCTPTRLSTVGMSHTCLCLPSYNWELATNRNINQNYFLTENISQIISALEVILKLKLKWSEWSLTITDFSYETEISLFAAFDPKPEPQPGTATVEVMWVWRWRDFDLLHSYTRSLIDTTITALTTPLYIMSTSDVNKTKFLLYQHN